MDKARTKPELDKAYMKQLKKIQARCSHPESAIQRVHHPGCPVDIVVSKDCLRCGKHLS